MSDATDKKRLKELLKSQQGLSALRIISDLLKNNSGAIERTAIQNAHPHDEESWGMDLPSAAEEEAALRGENPSVPHPLEDKSPHPQSHQFPWLLYHAGMGDKAGEAVANGMALRPSEVIDAISHGRYNPHRLFIRPSNKMEGWVQLSQHPNFKHAVKNHINDIYNRFTVSDENAQPEWHEEDTDTRYPMKIKRPSVGEFENSRKISVNAMNPVEMAMIKRSHKR